MRRKRFLPWPSEDNGQHDEALRTALAALARTLPLYRRAIENYARELTDRTNDGPSALATDSVQE